MGHTLYLSKSVTHSQSRLPGFHFSVSSSYAATFPDELGMSVPLVEEEQKELLYVPLDGEWGCRTRAEECERIIKAMDQLCTLGVISANPLALHCLAASTHFP